MNNESSRTAWWTLAVTAGTTFLLLFGLSLLHPNSLTPALFAGALLYPPCAEAWFCRESFEHFGLSRRRWGAREARIFFLLTAVCIVFYAAGYHLWQVTQGGKHLQLAFLPALPFLVQTLLFHLLVVAFPEEFFFRGYLQRRLAEHLGESKGLSAPYKSILLSNFAFAAIHFFGGGTGERLLTLFPGLLFGWLFWRTKNLIFPICFHATCNFVVAILHAVYR